MIDLNQLLCDAHLDPETTLCMRHRPVEAELRRAFLWVAGEQPDLFNMYQRAHRPREEKQLKKATHLAAFIGHDAGKALFVGIYRNDGNRHTSFQERQNDPTWIKLVEYGFDNGPGERLWFDLTKTDHLADWSGKLIVKWTSERSWSRWAGRNSFEVLAINQESLFAEVMPDWRELNLSWSQLKLIPAKWKAALAEWRGVYFILDISDGKGYVGSAYGDSNIAGRWANYAKSGHGGNKRLRTRKPENLRFSILERVSPDTPADDVIRLEATWKNRLHTRDFGLNEN